MTEARFNMKVIDRRVFLSTFCFSLIAGLNLVSSSFLNVFLARSYGVSSIGAIGLLWSSLFYLLDPVLYFVVFYVYCRGPLFHRIASVLISIVFGSLLGFWIGYVSGALLITALLSESAIAAFSNIMLTLPGHAVGQLLTAFAVLALSEIVGKWNKALPGENRSRPSGLFVLVFFYVVLALLNVLAVPIMAIYAIFNAATPVETLSAAALVSITGLAVAGQLALAIGLYYGKKWAWILALISSASSTLIDISAITAVILSIDELHAWLTWLVSGLFIGLLISVTVLAFLMSEPVRQFFGFVNPVERDKEDGAADSQ